MKALIIDGQNNHGIWPKTTMMLKDYLEGTGLFKVDVERTAFTWQGPHNDNDIGFNKEQRLKLLENFPITGSKKYDTVPEPVADPGFKPDFSQYDVVISNLDGVLLTGLKIRVPHLKCMSVAAAVWLLFMRPVTRLANGVNLTGWPDWVVGGTVQRKTGRTYTTIITMCS